MPQTASKEHRHGIWQKTLYRGVLPIFVLGLALVLTVIGGAQANHAQAATSSTLNFQGRLRSNTGAIVPDGSYNIEFNLYTVSSSGTTEWTETHTNQAGNPITVQNGYFSVDLGNATSGTVFPSTINWDQEHWLGMTVRGTGASCAFGACTPTDAEMTPRFKLTAVPYALRAGALVDASGNAKTADQFAQISPAAIQAANSAVAALRLSQAGAGGFVQFQNGGSDVFAISNTGGTTIAGSVLAQNTTNSANAFDVKDSSANSYIHVDTLGGSATFGANSGTTSTTLQGGTGGVSILSGTNVNIGQADSNATLLVIDSSSGGDPTGTNGAMYYNTVTNKFRCYENGFWKDCIGGSSSGSSHVSFVSGLQNVPANGTNLTVETMVFTSATAVSNVAGVTGFTAPADGSFRSCLVKDNAAITAGTLSLRWMVNGVATGSAACTMDATNSRQAATTLNSGVVTFHAGDTIGLSFDTSNTFAPAASNDFTVYWGVEYSGSSSGGTSGTTTLQDAYNNSLSASILTANNKDIKLSLADTAIDSNFVVDILSGSSSKFKVQNNGSDVLSVDATGGIVSSSGITLGNSTSTTAGTIRWTGLDFQGYDGSNWLSLTSGSSGSSVSSNYVNIVKTVNETVNNSAALQDDDQLVFAIGPNETWTYRFVVQANSGTVPDLQFAVNAPAGATCNNGYSDAEGATAIGQIGCGTTLGLVAGNGAVDLYEIAGTVINGSTAGNVTLRWAQNTANASNTIVYAGSYVTAYRSMGAGGVGQPFVQGGNSFGTTATIGTGDANGLSIITNNTQRIGVSSTGTVSIAGLTNLSGDLTANRTATATTGTTSGTGTNTTTLTLAADSFNIDDVIFIDNVGQDYYTRVTADPGTGTYTVSPAITFENTRTVTKYTVQSIGATSTDYTSQANRFFQGYFLGGVVVGAGSTTISDGNISSTTDLTLQSTGGNTVVGGGLSVTGTISGNGSGLTNLNGANISGSAITGINASNISTGTLNDARLSTNVALLSGSQTFTGAKDFSAGLTVSAGNIGVTGNINASGSITGATIVGDGSALTNLNASNIATGTVNDARLSTNVALLTGTQTFSGAKTFSGGVVVSAGNLSVTGNITATGGGVFTGDGSGLTNLSGASISGSSITGINASNISTGTLNDGRLSANVALLGATTQTFSGTMIVSGAVNFNGGTTLGDAAGDGLTITSSAVALPNGLNFDSNTLVIDATNNRIGINNASPGNRLNINTPATADSLATALLSTGLSTNKGLVIQGVTSQSANLFEVQNNGGGTPLAGFNATGGLFIGQSTITSAATTARAVSLPDDAGTICLSNKDTCGYLRLASGAAQTDASNNDVISVNKTSVTGNLISLSRSGTPVFTVANSGALQIQSTSSTALDIRNAGGTSYFTVDTSTGEVQIGANVADAVGVLLTLDTKNTAGDPTGQNGGMYYNSALSQFRCYRDGAWESCSSNPIERNWVVEDEFMSGATTATCSTTAAVGGALNWSCFNTGTATLAYNIGSILPTADTPGMLRMTTGATNGNGFTMAATGNNSGSVVLAPNQRVQASTGLGATLANARLRVGLHAETTSNVRPTTGVWWEADPTTNANWQYCYGTGAAATCASSGVAVAASTLYSLDIQITSTTAGASSATFSIDGTSFTVSGVTISTAARVNPAIACFNSTGAARECFVDYYRASGTASGRR